MQLSKEEETAKRADFMYRVGVGLYERRRYESEVGEAVPAMILVPGELPDDGDWPF